MVHVHSDLHFLLTAANICTVDIGLSTLTDQMHIQLHISRNPGKNQHNNIHPRVPLHHDILWDSRGT